MTSNKKINAEDSEDHEIFDINDFTTASDWERFIVQIEEVISEWKLNSTPSEDSSDLHKDLNFENGEWEQKSETIQFAEEISFTLTYYFLTPKNTHNISSKKNESSELSKSDSVDFDSTAFSAIRQTSNMDANSVSIVNLPPKSMADLLNKTNDFQIVTSSQFNTPSVAYFYGLCRFIVISPTRCNNFIDTESRANVILSSISIAINNTGCLVPIFVQVNMIERDMYLGLCEGSALKTHFQTVHFRYTPPQYSFLPGLLEIFKSKIGNHLNESSYLISVSVRFTYLIQELDEIKESKRYQIKDKSMQDIDIVDDKLEDIYPDIKNLPFASEQECIESIYLACTWSNLSEDIIVDSESYNDLNPQHSNHWCITINNILEKCEYKLSNCLNQYLNELKKTITVSQLIGQANPNSSHDLNTEELKQKSLQKLTSSGSAVRKLDQMYNMGSNIVEKATNKMRILNINDTILPIDKGFLDFIMDFLFPDANLRQSNISSNQVINTIDSSDDYFFKKMSLLKASSLKNDGLLNKFVICLNLINQLGKSAALAQLWQEFVLELRYRYDSAVLIPGLGDDLNKVQSEDSIKAPDLSRCLLHQKIQMLNCCIKKKLERQQMEKKIEKQIENECPKNNSDEDEFFDCEDEQPAIAEGRFKKFGELTLLRKPSEPLYVPKTQEPAPMTEDMLDQHASVLLNLGNNDEASILRAKIQSASLLSDMQAFKAANPGCVLEDFVRWYSPRDWVQVEIKEKDSDSNEEKITKKYDLSNRMKIPGNMWVEVWETAKPVPVRRQKRLFDDTKEAEQIFEWLNSLSIGKIIELTLPIIFYSSIYTCYAEAFNLELSSITEPIFEAMIDKATKITRSNETNKYQDLVNYIKSFEQIVTLMKSLNAKFKNRKAKIAKEDMEEVENFLRKLLKQSLDQEFCHINIEDGGHSVIGLLISRLCRKKNTVNKPKISRYFNEHQSIKNSFDLSEDEEDDEAKNMNNVFLPFEKPFQREYILRSSVPRPAPYSRQSPQRMYCRINNIEFKLAGAFTEDTMFY